MGINDEGDNEENVEATRNEAFHVYTVGDDVDPVAVDSVLAISTSVMDTVKGGYELNRNDNNNVDTGGRMKEKLEDPNDKSGSFVTRHASAQIETETAKFLPSKESENWKEIVDEGNANLTGESEWGKESSQGIDEDNNANR